MKFEFNEGDRVQTSYLDKGTVVEYLGEFDFPKVRVLLDGSDYPNVFYADSLRLDKPDEELERVLVIAENSESTDALTLAAEVRRLRRGIDAARAEAERYKKIGDESRKDSYLSWYDTDHYHEQRQAVGSAAEDILEALEKGLGETE
jgi:hypothetical protein